MDEGTIFGRGIGFPPRIGPDGRLAWSAGAQNIREAIQIILLTELQERIFLPGFGGGLQTFLFQPNTPATFRLIEDRITQALASWEPRITVTSVVVQADPTQDQTAIATIFYKLVATQVGSQITVSVRLTA
jgi:phage baseplate assembly protein W